MKFNIVVITLLFVGLSFGAYSGTPKAPSKVDGCYQIGSAEELYGFAELMNDSTNGLAQSSETCAKLTSDIVVNENVLKNDTLDNSRTDFIPWTPIVTYSGLLDGQGHKISGLFYISDKSRGSAGLFLSITGELEDKHAHIKNLGITDSYFYGDMYTGTFIGLAKKVSLENIYSNSVVSGNTAVGGLIGLASQNINIFNSYNEGNVYGVQQDPMYFGGIAGYIHTSKNIIRNCYNIGKISGLYYAAGLVGIVGRDTELTIENSFNIDPDNLELIDYYDKASTLNIINTYTIATSSSGYKKTSEEFANGNVAIALHYSAYGNVWGQEIGKDLYPTLNGKITNYSSPLKISNVILHTYDGDTNQYFSQYAEGVGAELPQLSRQGYIFAGWFDNNQFTGNAVSKISTKDTGDLSFYAKWQEPFSPQNGCYEISNADELFLFAARVNGQDGMAADPSACGKLMNDIIVNNDVLNSDYSLNTKGSFRAWIPLKTYRGHFDGQGHTISGLYINDEKSDQLGFIRATSNGSEESPTIIENLGIINSYIHGHDKIGVFIGSANGRTIIQNSYSNSAIIGETFVGGLIGYQWGNISLTNVYSSGKIYGFQCIGGLLGGSKGSFTSILNSFSFGSISGRFPSEPLLGYIESDNHSAASIVHSYYYTHETSKYGGIHTTIDKFADGTIAKALHEYNENGVDGSVWGQNIGVDSYPVHSGKITYTNTSSSSSSDTESSSSVKSSSSKEIIESSSSSEKTNIATISTKALQASIYLHSHSILVENFVGNVSVFDLNGNLIRSVYSNGQTVIHLQRTGSYIVKTGAYSQRISLTTRH